MKKCKSLLIIGIVILMCFSSNVSLASKGPDDFDTMINSILNNDKLYEIVDCDDNLVTSEFIKHVKNVGLGYEYVLRFLSSNDYSIKKHHTNIQDPGQEPKYRLNIINTNYGSTYTKVLQTNFNGKTHYLTVSFGLTGQLDYDAISGVIYNVYSPGVYILGFDKEAYVNSIQVTGGNLTNGNKTVNHSITIKSTMLIPIQGTNSYTPVEMPIVYQNFSFTPIAN